MFLYFGTSNSFCGCQVKKCLLNCIECILGTNQHPSFYELDFQFFILIVKGWSCKNPLESVFQKGKTKTLLELLNTLIFTALNNINTINTSTLQYFLTCLQGSQKQVEICNKPLVTYPLQKDKI